MHPRPTQLTVLPGGSRIHELRDQKVEETIVLNPLAIAITGTLLAVGAAAGLGIYARFGGFIGNRIRWAARVTLIALRDS